MTFLNILGVTVILCILRLVSEIKYVERSLSHQDKTSQKIGKHLCFIRSKKKKKKTKSQ